MTQKSLSLLKELFAEGLQFSANHTGYFFRPSSALDETQSNLVQSAPDFQTFCWSSQIYNYIRQFGYEPKPTLSIFEEQRQSGVQFLYSVQSKYTVSGATEFQRFNFTLWRCNVCPPEVLRRRQLPMDFGSLWLLTGGHVARDAPWENVGAIWLEDNEYQEWSLTEFLFRGDDEPSNMHVRFGSPQTLQFQLSLTEAGPEGEPRKSLHIVLQAKAPPQPLTFSGGDVNPLNRVYSYIFADVVADVTLSNTPPSSGLAFLQHTEVRAPPTDLFGQAAFVRTLPALGTNPQFPTVILLCVQFPSYQYILTLVLRRPIFAGLLLTELLHGVRCSYGTCQTLRSIQVMIAWTITFDNTPGMENREFPYAVQILSENDGISGDAGSCYALVRNAANQLDYEAVLRVTDIHNTVGCAIVRLNNVLDATTWALDTMKGSEALVLLTQPIVVHRSTAHLLGALPWIIVVILLVVLLLVVLLLRKK